MNRSKNKVILLWLGAFVLYFLIVFGLVFFEQQAPTGNIKTMADGLWYSLITLTTVGYGDYYPVTTMGKVFALLIILSSIGVLGYLIGRISSAISEYLTRQKMGLNGTDLENHFVIIGWDDFANKIVNEIVKSKNKLAVVTDIKDDIEAIQSIYSGKEMFTLFNDHKDYEGLKNANIENSSNVFVNFNDDTETLVYIINLQKRYPKLDFVVLLNSGDLKETFESIGVKHTIAKNEITSKLVASYLFEPDVAMFTDDLMSTSNNEKDMDLLQFKVVSDNPFKGRSYMDAFVEVKQKYNGVLLGLSRNATLIKNPGVEESIHEDDYLVMMANGVSKAQLEKEFRVLEGRV